MRVVLSRQLGAEGLGIYQIALSVFAVYSTLVSGGLPVTISHKSAKSMVSKNKKMEGATLSSALIISCTLATILSIFTLVFKDLLISVTNPTAYTILLIMIPGIYACGIGGCFRGALWGRKRHFENSITELLEQIFRLTLICFLINVQYSSSKSAILASICLCSSYIFSTIISIFFYFKNKGILFYPKDEFMNILKTSTPITCVRLCSSIGTSLISLILPLRLVAIGYTEELTLSLFGIVSGMTLPLLMFPNTLIGAYATALVPELTTLLEQKNQQDFDKEVKTSITTCLFIVFCFVPLFIGLGEQIGVLLFNNSTSGSFLVKSAWIIIPNALCAISSSILNVLNMETKSFINYIIGFVVMFIFSWFMPLVIGIDALVYGMGACITIASILNLLMIYKKCNCKNLVLKPLFLMTLFTIPSIMITTQTYKLLRYIMPSFFSISISGGLGIIFFILLSLMFDVINIYNVLPKIKNVNSLKQKRKKKFAFSQKLKLFEKKH